MNKVMQINLGGLPFTIDEDAYHTLESYLGTLKRHFADSPGSDDILGDIESRIGELFQEQMGSRSIVTLPIVKSAIAAMGTPEDFGAEAAPEPPRGKHASGEAKFRPGKRLMRDGQDEVVGGVCSGLAAYLGVQDPVWVRLAFVLGVVVFGFGVPLYIILMIVLPKAETAADRLAMRGDPINIDNIAKIIEDNAAKLGQKAEEWGKKVEDKAENFTSQEAREEFRKKGEPITRGAKSVVVMLVGLIGKVVATGLQLVKRVFQVFGFGLFGVLSFTLAILWFAFVVGGIKLMPLSQLIVPGNYFVPRLALMNGFFLLGIPVAFFAMFMSSRMFKTKINPFWYAGLGGFWLLNAFSMGGVGTWTASQFRKQADHSEVLPITDKADTVFVGYIPRSEWPIGGDDRDWSKIEWDDVEFFKNGNIQGNADLSIYNAAQNWSLTRIARSRGNSSREADQLATTVQGHIRQTRDSILFSPTAVILNGTKWRAQDLSYNLEVPVGTYLRFDPKIQEMVNTIPQPFPDRGEYNYIPNNPGALWRMEADGLHCLDCNRNEYKKGPESEQMETPEAPESDTL